MYYFAPEDVVKIYESFFISKVLGHYNFKRDRKTREGIQFAQSRDPHENTRERQTLACRGEGSGRVAGMMQRRMKKHTARISRQRQGLEFSQAGSLSTLIKHKLFSSMRKGQDNVHCPALPMGTKSGVPPGFLAEARIQPPQREKKLVRSKGIFYVIML